MPVFLGDDEMVLLLLMGLSVFEDDGTMMTISAATDMLIQKKLTCIVG